MIAFPLFIVGSPRSGTSILTQALRNAGYFGYSEGNFLAVLRKIEVMIDRQFSTAQEGDKRILTTHLNKETLKTALYKAVADSINDQYSGKVWLDKTGNADMIEAIPILLRLWPTSHFIFAKRRAIENIVSRIQKFPRHSFEYHCTDWAKNMAAWRRLTISQPGLPAIEVDQRDISDNPGAVATRISRFLDLSPEAESKVTSTFGTAVPQQTAPGSARRNVPLSATGWTETQMKLFHQHCDEQMVAYGYTEDEKYHVNQISSRANDADSISP